MGNTGSIPGAILAQAAHPHYLTTGLRAYTPTGVLGRPSLATADKGAKVLAELTARAAAHVELLRSDSSHIR